MQNITRLFASILLITFMTTTAFATIFGADDRQELASKPDYLPLSRGIAMWLSPVFYKINSRGLQLEFPAISRPEAENLCSDERFASQPANSVACTGFLIAPDLLVTAGHCMVPTGGTKRDERPPTCTDFNWLFDYTANISGQVSLKNLSTERLLECKRVVYATNNPIWDPIKQVYSFGDDFALIQLSRPLKNRPVFTLAKESVRTGDTLTVIAHPSGLPLKIHEGRVLSPPANGFFRTDLDAFGGESGAPVLNARKEVVGILVRGFPDADYVNDSTRECRRVNVCKADGTSCTRGDEYTPGTEIQTLDGLSEILKDLDRTN